MTTRDDAWPAGTPCWVDVLAADVVATASFYSSLFGWDIHDEGPAAGGYRMGLLDGRPVAGIGPLPEGGQMPAAWTTYLATDDAEQSAAKVKEAGGTVLMEPFDVLDIGRMGVAFDPTGAMFGLWQAKSHIGSQLVNQAGTLIWSECMSGDYEAAKAFYAHVFGYEYDDMGDGENFQYSLLKVDGHGAGGIGGLSADVPQEIPSHWMTYFGIPDTDAAVHRATEFGGELRMGPMDSPYGRMAVLAGPAGEVFALMSVDATSSPLAGGQQTVDDALDESRLHSR